MSQYAADKYAPLCPPGAIIGVQTPDIPPDPLEGLFVVWMSTAGDVLMKVTFRGVTKTVVLCNFAAA